MKERARQESLIEADRAKRAAAETAKRPTQYNELEMEFIQGVPKEQQNAARKLIDEQKAAGQMVAKDAKGQFSFRPTGSGMTQATSSQPTSARRQLDDLSQRADNLRARGVSSENMKGVRARLRSLGFAVQSGRSSPEAVKRALDQFDKTLTSLEKTGKPSFPPRARRTASSFASPADRLAELNKQKADITRQLAADDGSFERELRDDLGQVLDEIELLRRGGNKTQSGMFESPTSASDEAQAAFEREVRAEQAAARGGFVGDEADYFEQVEAMRRQAARDRQILEDEMLDQAKRDSFPTMSEREVLENLDELKRTFKDDPDAMKEIARIERENPR